MYSGVQVCVFRLRLKAALYSRMVNHNFLIYIIFRNHLKVEKDESGALMFFISTILAEISVPSFSHI